METRRAYEWGLVCQALAGAMRHVLQDWELMVAQLEHQLRAGKLTLQVGGVGSGVGFSGVGLGVREPASSRCRWAGRSNKRGRQGWRRGSARLLHVCQKTWYRQRVACRRGAEKTSA